MCTQFPCIYIFYQSILTTHSLLCSDPLPTGAIQGGQWSDGTPLVDNGQMEHLSTWLWAMQGLTSMASVITTMQHGLELVIILESIMCKI